MNRRESKSRRRRQAAARERRRPRTAPDQPRPNDTTQRCAAQRMPMLPTIVASSDGLRVGSPVSVRTETLGDGAQ